MVLASIICWGQGNQNFIPLKDVFKDMFLLGTAIDYGEMYSKDSELQNLIATEFNALVPGNCMKADHIEPWENVFNFRDGDALVALGQKNNQVVTGHCLVWHSQVPRWMFVDAEGKEVSRDVLIQRMKNHIYNVAGHYRGKVKGWDVVNEAIEWDGSWRNSPYYRIIGEDFIRLAFQFAHEADPDAELYYNDYGMDCAGRRDAVVRLIRDLKAHGLRIDAIGMQSHLSLQTNLVEYEKSLRAFANEGVKVMATELDVSVLPWPGQRVSAEVSQSFEYQEKYNPYRNGIPDSVTQQLGNFYRRLFDIYRRNSKDITRVTFWGVHDGGSWLNNFPMHGRTNYPLMFGRDLKRKPFVQDIINDTMGKDVEADLMHEVIVTGTNNATSSNHIPYTVTTVSHEQIEATGRTQLLSALSGRIPSLFVTERNSFGFGVSNGGSGGIKIRGVGGSPSSQVLMMVDGKPQFTGVYSHPVADNYESEYVDHVEVLRGPASVLYGSNAMGGAINIITRTPRQDGSRTTVKSQYGSDNTTQNSVTNQLRYGKFTSTLSAGYDRTDGTQKNFDFWQASGYAKFGYEFSCHWSATADYSIMKYQGNDPIYATIQATPGTYICHQEVLRGEASVVADNHYRNTNGAVRLYYSHGNHKIQDPKDFLMLDDRIGVLAYQNYQPAKMTNLTLGMDFNRYTGKIPMSGGNTIESGGMGTLPRQQIVEYSPYLTASQGIWNNLLILNAGLRIANSNMFGTHVLPQGGITLNPGKGWTVKASVAKGYRNPSFKELYIYYPRSKNNPNLKPEEMMNYEVSIAHSFGKCLTAELTGYIAKGKNMIALDENMKNINTGSFLNKGIEVAVSSHPIRQLNLRATYSVMSTDMDMKYRVGAPKHQYSIAADWNILPQLILNADLMGISELYVAQDVEMQSYALLNLKLTYRALKCLDLFVQGNNITNARYCINKGYTMPGTTATGGFRFTF